MCGQRIQQAGMSGTPIEGRLPLVYSKQLTEENIQPWSVTHGISKEYEDIVQYFFMVCGGTWRAEKL